MSLRAQLGSLVRRAPHSRRKSPVGGTNRLNFDSLENRITPAAHLTIGDVSIVEGHGGPTLVMVQVNVTEPHGNSVSVDFTTVDGSALAGSDFSAVSGTLNFPRNVLSRTVSISVSGDRLAESTEYFTVRLSNSRGAKIADGAATVQITDDEPWISVTDWWATEGNSDTKEFTFTVTLSSAYDQTVMVDFATANGSAFADSDYEATNGTLTFLQGQPTSQDITVIVNGDMAAEYDEYFMVNLSNASSNAQISDSAAVGTIANDEPTVSIWDSWFYYDSGYMVFTVTLSAAPTDAAVTVDFTTWDGTAYAGTDYVATSGTLTFDIGETVQYIYVEVLNFNYTDIYFGIQLSNASSPAQFADDWAAGYWYYDYGYYYDWGYYDYGYGWY